MDILKSKLPPTQRVLDIKNRPRIPIPDEDPYSVAGSSRNAPNGSVAATREQLLLQTQQHAQRRSDKPPKLPPRENMYPHDIPKPDYDDTATAPPENNKSKGFQLSRRKEKKPKDSEKYEDPYYCGLRARVPNFVAQSKLKAGKEMMAPNKRMSVIQKPPQPLNMAMMQPPHVPHNMSRHQQGMWHSRSYESGIDSESPYNQIYERLPIPTRYGIPTQPRTMYIGEWD